MIYSEDAPKLENELHNEFVHRRINKINLRKEFFRVQLADVRHLLESKEVSVHWTMLAEAREYRETLAIEHDSHLPRAKSARRRQRLPCFEYAGDTQLKSRPFCSEEIQVSLTGMGA